MTNSNAISENQAILEPLRRKALATARKALKGIRATARCTRGNAGFAERIASIAYGEKLVRAVQNPANQDICFMVKLMNEPVIGTFVIEWLYQNYTGPEACPSDYVVKALERWENAQNAQAAAELYPVDLRDPEN